MSPHREFGTQPASWEDDRRMDSAYHNALSKSKDQHTPSSSSTGSKPTRPHIPLRQRQQPVPFILPCPLGPLPPPGGNNFQATPSSSRESTPRAFAPLDAYPWTSSYSHSGPRKSDGGTYTLPPTPYASFSPVAELTRRQSLGTFTLPSSTGGYAPPPHTYSRPSTGPLPGQSTPLPSSMPSSGPSPPYSPIGQPIFPPPEAQRVLYPKPAAEIGTYPPPRDVVVQYRCDQCQGVFGTNGGLKRHKRTHSAKKYQYSGGVGGGAYGNRAVLREHQGNIGGY